MDNDSSQDHIRERIDASGAVFFGQVETVSPGDSVQRPSALFRTTRWWKGSRTDTVRIMLRVEVGTSTSCDMTMKPGERYVVFASTIDRGELYVGVCGTRADRYADALLRTLGTGSPPHGREVTRR